MGKHDEYEEAKENYAEMNKEAWENQDRSESDPKKWTKEEELSHTENMRTWTEAYGFPAL